MSAVTLTAYTQQRHTYTQDAPAHNKQSLGQPTFPCALLTRLSLRQQPLLAGRVLRSQSGADYNLLASVTPLLQRFGPSACTQDAVQGAVHTLESASWISCWLCVAIRAE